MKFSQIAAAGANLASTDFLMGVQSGTTDVLFTPAQVASFISATPAGSSGQVQYNNAAAFGGANVWVESANVLALRNSTTAQGLYVYNTYTDASNYERGVFDWTTTANVLTIGMQKAGTGAIRQIVIQAPYGAGAYGITLDGGQGIADYVKITAGNAADFFFAGALAGRFNGNGLYLNSLPLALGPGLSPDTGISRSAAGVLAIGNGTAGDGSATILAKTKAGAPTTSDVPAGTWVLIRDTTNATTKLYYNNAGTLMSVALT